MNDREFSSPSAEFSPPEAEFAPPVREWSSPGNEISHVDSAPPRKKRRRIPSMMVAAAAAVTVGLSSLLSISTTVVDDIPHTVVDDIPHAALTEDQIYYLDSIIEATLDEDIPRIENLATDPMMKQIMEEVVEPYYDNALLPYDASYSNTVNRSDTYIDYNSIAYDGTTLVASNYYSTGIKLLINNRLYIDDSLSNSRIGWNIPRQQPYKIGEPYDMYSFTCFINTYGVSRTLFRPYQERIIPADNEDGLRRDFCSGKYYESIFSNGICDYTIICEGDCLSNIRELSSGLQDIIAYFENGTVTLHTGDGHYETTFPIIDGYAKPGDEVEIVNSSIFSPEEVPELIWYLPSGEELHIRASYRLDNSNASLPDLYHIFWLFW